MVNPSRGCSIMESTPTVSVDDTPEFAIYTTSIYSREDNELSVPLNLKHSGDEHDRKVPMTKSTRKTMTEGVRTTIMYVRKPRTAFDGQSQRVGNPKDTRSFCEEASSESRIWKRSIYTYTA
jgi:hypothetical protein